MIVDLDTPVTVVFIDKETKAEVYRQDTTAEGIDGCVTVTSIMFNALSMSGGVLWRHPTTGQLYPRGIGWHIELIHPETGETVTAIPTLP